MATIFKLSEQPDTVCGDLLCVLAGKVFLTAVGVAPEVGVVSEEGIPPPLTQDVGEFTDDFQPQMTSSQGLCLE